MRSKLYILIGMFFPLAIYSQVGINTSDPKGVYHIDGKADGSSTAVTSANDVLVNDKGFLGAGTTNPTVKLHIEVPAGSHGLAIQDGTEDEGYILSSDADGNGSWIVSDISQFSTIPYTASMPDFFSDNNYTYNTGFEVEFPKYGSYAIALSCRVIISRSANDTPRVFGLMFSRDNASVNIPGAVLTPAVYLDGTTYIYQIYINQNIDINVTTGLKMGLKVLVNGDFTASTGSISAIMGDGSTLSGGTYIRVK